MATAPNDSETEPTPNRGLAIFVAAVLVVQLVSLSTFNHQPQIVHLAVEGLLFVSYVILFACAVLNARWQTLLYLLGFSAFVACELAAYSRSAGSIELLSFARDAAGPIALMVVTVRRPVAPPRRVLWGLWLVLMATGVTAAGFALLGPKYFFHGENRLALIAGGVDGLHPSGYAATCFLLLLLVFLRSGVGIRWLTGLLAVVMFAVVLGYQVRTTWAMLAALAVFLSFIWLARRSRHIAAAAIGVVLLVVPVGVASLKLDLAKFSSGRTLIYQERLRLLSSRPPIETFFGSGSGTDMLRGVSAWREMARDSHNDFLTTAYEEGLVGLTGLLFMLLAVFFALPPTYRGWLLMIVVSSAFSNGILMRPAVGPPLALITYLAVALRNFRREERQNIDEVEEEGAAIFLSPQLYGGAGNPAPARVRP